MKNRKKRSQNNEVIKTKTMKNNETIASRNSMFSITCQGSRCRTRKDTVSDDEGELTQNEKEF
jgi:hypothetical protein